MPSEKSYFSLNEAAKLLEQDEVVLLQSAAMQQITLLLRIPIGYQTHIQYPREFYSPQSPTLTIFLHAIRKSGHGVFDFVELDYRQAHAILLHNGQSHLNSNFSTAYVIDSAALLKVDSIGSIFQVTPYNHSEEMEAFIESNKDMNVLFSIRPINKSLNENALINCTDIYLSAGEVEQLRGNEPTASESRAVRASPSWHDAARALAIQIKAENPEFIQKQIVTDILKILNEGGHKNMHGNELKAVTITRIAFQKANKQKKRT